MSVRAMAWVWDSSRSGGTDRLLLVALADAANDSGVVATMSIGELAAKTGVDQRTVQRGIRRLQLAGEVHVDESEGGKASNSYTVVMNRPEPGGPQGSPAGPQRFNTAPGWRSR